jgi:solute carrier family 31 (copper transporter), member 1
MDSTSSNSSMMMTPYLHFMTGDYLYLKTWHPTSTGAVAGACIGLVVLALFDRWLAATRGVLDLRWRQRSYNFGLA